jgi:SAM-dependent methyltransferase
MTDGQLIFDRAAVRRHRDRAAARVDRVAPILRESAARLLDRLDDTTRHFATALDIGGRGVVAPLLRARGLSVVTSELSANMAARESGTTVVADEERLPFAPASFDLIVANLSLHWANDLPGVLIQIRMALRPGGLFLASLPAVGTLDQLWQALTEAETAETGGASPRVSPFIDVPDGAALMQRAGFALPVVDVDTLALAYASPMGLLDDLRAGGESNALRLRSRQTPPRALFPRALARLPQRDGRVPVTLRMAVLTGWAPGAAA